MTPLSRLFATVCLALFATAAQAAELKLAVTTSFHNSGLSDALLPEIKADTGLDIQLLVVGTGQAIRLGQAGDVDAILVHSRQAEDAFVAAGFAKHRREIMFNDFILVGPTSDPANAKRAAQAAEAFAIIAEFGAIFVSRGDDSGTHSRERAIWAMTDAAPAPPWYRALGAGMGATLNTAAAMGAYTLSDRASWLNFGNRSEMAITFEGDPALFNQYAFLPVNPDRHPHVAAAAAQTLERWLTSERGQALIGDYQIDGQTLFKANATQIESDG